MQSSRAMPQSIPNVTSRLGLGIGLDMPWTADGQGFRLAPQDGDPLPKALRYFFDLHRERFSYTFVAFQPKGRNLLRADDYFEAYDHFFASAEGSESRVRAFHQTILNL